MENHRELFVQDEINEIIYNNRNSYCKEIGDRVNILDYSSCSHLNGRELNSEQDKQMQFNNLTYFIVIQDRQRHEYDAYYARFNQDLIIVNPETKTQYRVSSGHLELK